MGMFGRKRREGEAAGLPEWAEFFGNADRYERFERAVRRYFRGRGEGVLIEEGRVRGPGLGELQLGLTNIGQLCAQSEEGDWPGLIAQHFDAMKRAQVEIRNMEERLELASVRPQLAIRLHTEQDIAGIRDVAVVREDVPGLVSLLCLDLPNAVQSLKREQIGHWGESDDELFAIARGNLAGLIDVEPERVQVDDATVVWFAAGGSLYNSSALLRLEDYPQFAGRHGMFVSAPTRHAVLALAFDSPAALNSVGHLMGLTAHMEHEGPGSLSTRVWWHKDGEWIEIPWEMKEEGIAVSPPEEFIEMLEEIAGGEGDEA